MKRIVIALILASMTALSIFAEEAANVSEQDVLYLGEGGPVLLRLRVRIEGKAGEHRWEHFLTKLFDHLDRNRNGWLDRIEAARIPSATSMAQMFKGNLVLQPTRPGNNQVSFDTLDTDHDGQITREELFDWCRSIGAGPFAIGQAVISGSPADTLTQRLFGLLDLNGDSKLSLAELRAAETTLAPLDTSDDELISPAELGRTLPNQVRGQQLLPAAAVARLGNPSTLPTSLRLVPDEEQGKRMGGRMRIARELLKEMDRDNDGKLSPGEWSYSKSAFVRIDRNGDGKIDTLELSRMLAGKPAGDFLVNLNSDAATPVRGMKTEKASAGRNSMRIHMGESCLTVVPQPFRVASTNWYRTSMINLFQQIDTEKKEFLTRQQLNLQQHWMMLGIFDLADRNGDARLTMVEMKALLDIFDLSAGAQITLSLRSTGQGLFETLDTNGDGGLSIRELRNAALRLAEFDTNHDELISRSEFPHQVQLQVGGSALMNYVSPVAVRPGMDSTRPLPTQGPVWFRKMDRNRDGDVSRKEWLGTADQFALMDADQDGLISLAEAVAAETRFRKSVE